MLAGMCIRRLEGEEESEESASPFAKGEEYDSFPRVTGVGSSRRRNSSDRIRPGVRGEGRGPLHMLRC